MRPPRRGEIWTVTGSPLSQTVLVISSTVYNEIASEPTVLVALVVGQATEEGFCVDLGQQQWAVMGMVTFVPKATLSEFGRRVDVQVLTDVNNMLLMILATPER